MKRILSLVVIVFASSLFAIEDEVDPRQRVFVWPKRIVWQSDGKGYLQRYEVKNADALLKDGHAQRHASGIWKPAGCQLRNSGDTASVIVDFGREIHGAVQIAVGFGTPHGMQARVRFGESVGEAMSSIGEKGATNDHALRDGEITLPSMGTIELGQTGFRFVRLDLLTPGTLVLNGIRAVSLMRPMKRVGAFACSDERLNRVWETSVRTVHLCCQDYLWDGIKRDRLAWMGDTHPEIRSILSVFGAAEVLPRTFEYMEGVTPPGQWMNGMPNYTLWYLRNVWEWWRYTGDRSFVEKRGEYLKRTIAQVLSSVTADGRCTLKGFLDWPTQHNQVAVTNGTHALCATTLDCSVELARILGDAQLREKCIDAAKRLRTRHPDPANSKAAAALLALGGIHPPKKMYADILGQNGHNGVSTFYGYYMLEAMSAAGENQRAIDTIRDYWGGMLDMGATSFWEDFNLAWTNGVTRLDEVPVEGRKNIHGDFGEFCYPGYRHSLCHGWSSGPAAWLIHHVLGINSLEPGCRKVEVKPFLGNLKWAEGALATPFGPVRVRAEKTPSGEIKTTISAPSEIKIVEGSKK